MAGSTVKMGVDVTQFKQGMKEAQNSVKTLDAALKYNEKQMKSSGNAEKDFTTQANLLNAKLKEQKTVASNAEKALKEMEKNGVRTSSSAYQDMQRQLINAQSAILDTEAAINSLGTAEQATAQNAVQLSDSVASIGKKMSLQQVQEGLGKISESLKNAAGFALELGKNLVSSLMEGAQWADDLMTNSVIFGIDAETLQKWDRAATHFDVTVESFVKSRQKLSTNLKYGSKETEEAFRELLGDNWKSYTLANDNGVLVKKYKDVEDVLWEVGGALSALDRNNPNTDALAQKLLGRSWSEMLPLFTHTREEFDAFMDDTSTVSDEATENLADLQEAVDSLQYEFGVTVHELEGALAPALTEVSNIITGIVKEFNDYLKTEEGQEKMKALSDAVVSLFEGMKDIKPGDVIDTAKSILDGIVGALQWISENWESVAHGIEAIAIAWGLIKVTEGTTALINFGNGLRGLGTGSGTPAPVPSGGTGTGVGTAGTGTALASAGATAAGGATFGAEISAAMAGGGFSGVAVAAAPVVAMAVGIALEKDRQKRKTEEQDMHLAVAAAIDEIAGDNRTADFIRRAALATGPERDENGNTIGQGFFVSMNPGDIDGMLKELKGLDESQMSALMEALRNYSPITAGNYSDTMLQNFLKGEGGYETWQLQALLENITSALEQAAGEGGLPLDVKPVIEDPAAANATIRDAIGTVVVPVEGDPTLMGYPHANGLFSVPWDGYPAILHKGERVVPAAQANNYNSNIYFGNVNLNNGLEIEALTESIDRRNRRQRSGYGAN